MRAALLFLLASGCSFSTDALDGALGTSCSHYELDTITVEASSECWRDQAADGDCFFSEGDACDGAHERLFLAGQRLTLWCPLKSRGEWHGLEPATCGVR